MISNLKNLKTSTLFTLFLLALLASFATVYFTFFKHKTVTLKLPTQTSIEDYLKIDVKPVQLVKGKEIVFLVRLESYQNKQSIQLDLKKVALLSDEESNTYLPKSWKVKESKEYYTTGYLTFPLPNIPKSIKLSIFEFEERDFVWNF